MGKKVKVAIHQRRTNVHETRGAAAQPHEGPCPQAGGGGGKRGAAFPGRTCVCRPALRGCFRG